MQCYIVAFNLIWHCNKNERDQLGIYLFLFVPSILPDLINEHNIHSHNSYSSASANTLNSLASLAIINIIYWDTHTCKQEHTFNVEHFLSMSH